MRAAKLQRWTDLLAALLRRQLPASFEELSRDVPDYTHDAKSKASTLRTFERDKDELRAFGVPVLTVMDGEGQTVGYRLSARDFYLPYLALAEPGRPAAVRKVDRYGYRALPTLEFDADELAAVAQAGHRVEQLDNSLLAADARSALRKLAEDLPVGGVATADQARVVEGRERARPETYTAINAALLARKRVVIEYHSLTDDATSERDVEPYGLFFLGSHWYLAARDSATGELRNFRLNRIRRAKANKQKPGTPDFVVPDTFRLRDHAQSKQAWELGSTDAVDVIVEFRAATGAALSTQTLGDPVDGLPNRRRFKVRRTDAFVRWLLSLAGTAVPVAPAELVDRFARAVRETAAIYSSGDDRPVAQSPSRPE
jgi:predicted DNA-binding transcriptional regulator YafY